MTEGQELVGLYVDTCVELGRREMIPLKGQVAKHAKRLLEDGVPLERARVVIVEFVKRRGRTALQLAEIYVELEREANETEPGLTPSARRRASQHVRDQGWPTGCRFVRGQHSGSHKHDVLGHDPVPQDWPYGRPSFDDIAAALA